MESAVRGLIGSSLAVAFDLSDEVQGGGATLDEEQLVERLIAELGAEEIFEQEGAD